ncbi:hypothetical protein B2A_08139, partial [mine drainage metagenome]
TMEDIPDPGAVLATVDALNSIFNMKVETAPLKETASKYHEEMKRIIQDYSKFQSGDRRPDSMYA